MRIAIIDLGSNTFHLLISDTSKNGFVEVFRKRVFVGLSEGGTTIIKSSKLKLGLETCKEFKALLKAYNVEATKVVGTAVLRVASNRYDFINPCQSILEENIEIIDGDREAELIYKGVSLLNLDLGSYVIMDIGGGSVEFIIVKNGLNIWSQSFKIGVGILHNLYHKEEPIEKRNVAQCKLFILKSIEPLIKELNGHNISALVGASGSFEVVKEIYNYQGHSLDIKMDDVTDLIFRLINMTLEERLDVEGLPEQRAKLIVVAMILIQVSIDVIKPTSLIVSPYALKEGLLSELDTK